MKEISIISDPGCSHEISFEELNPIPTASTCKIQRRKKQKSEILTETPNEEILVACELKKKVRQATLLEKLKQKSTKKGKSSTKHPSKNKKVLKRKIFEESESEEEISDSQSCDDDELDDMEADVEDRCLICNDSSKKDEYWFQCSMCEKWAHELCSGADSPEGYICDC